MKSKDPPYWLDENEIDKEAASIFEEEFFSEPTESDMSYQEASPWDFGIILRNKFSYDIKEDHEFESDYSNHIRGIMFARYRHSDRLHFKASVQGDYFSYHYESGWEDETDFRVHDAYVNFSGPGYNARIGNPIVRLGKADGFSPLDNVNPEDFRDGFAGRREERKIPVPMVNLQVYREPFSIQGLYIPFFIKSEFDTVGTDCALFGRLDKEIGPFPYDDPQFYPSISDSQGGARIAATTHGFDLALSYLNTINDLPTVDSTMAPAGFRLETDSIRDLPRFAQANGQAIQLRHDRTSIWGMEFETTIGSIGLRGDLAYNTDVNFLTETLERVEKFVFDYIIGFDYLSPADFYINFQFGQSFIRNFDDLLVFAKKNDQCCFRHNFKGILLW